MLTFVAMATLKQTKTICTRVFVGNLLSFNMFIFKKKWFNWNNNVILLEIIYRTKFFPAFAPRSAVFSSLWGLLTSHPAFCRPQNVITRMALLSQALKNVSKRRFFFFISLRLIGHERYSCYSVLIWSLFLLYRLHFAVWELIYRTFWLVSSVSLLFNDLLRRACTDLFCPWLLKISKHEDKNNGRFIIKTRP